MTERMSNRECPATKGVESSVMYFKSRNALIPTKLPFGSSSYE